MSYHCECDPHGDNAKCNRECCKPDSAPNKPVSTDFNDGFRAGFEASRTQLKAAIEQALINHTSIRKALASVEIELPPFKAKRDLQEEIDWIRTDRDRLAKDLAKAHRDAIAWIERAGKLAAELQLCKAGINDERDATGTPES